MSIHPVDRVATRIWFHLYPLALQRAMARPDAADLARRMTLAGRWSLADQVHTSHRLLYAHRFWAAVRQAVDEREREKLRECGVVVEGTHPVMRLSCMAQAYGPTTIVIPPWNGLVGRVLTATN